jgi:hypothetical protein
MSFYFYGFNEDRVSSITYPLNLTASQNETAYCVERHGPNVVTVAAISRQRVGPGGGGSAFSSGFSAGFGSLSSYIYVTVGRSFATVDADTAHLVEVKFTPHIQLAPTSSTETTGFAKKYFATVRPGVLSAYLANLFHTHPYHAVLANKQAYVGYSRASSGHNYHVTGQLPDPFTSDFNSSFGGGAGGTGTTIASQSNAAHISHMLGHSNFVSSSAAARIKRGFGLGRGGVSADLAFVVWSIGKIMPVLHQSAISSVPKIIGHFIQMLAGEATGQNTTRPQHLPAVSTDVAFLVLGNTVYHKLLVLLSNSVVTAGRVFGLSKTASSSEIVASIKILGRQLTGIDSQLSFLIRQLGHVANVIEANTATTARQIGLLRGIAASQFAGLQQRATHILALVGALTANIAQAFEQRSHLLYPSVLQAQALIALKSLPKIFRITASAVVASVRVPSRLLTMASTSATAFSRQLLVVRLLAVSAAEAVTQRASHGKAISGVSAEIAAMVAHHGTYLALASAEALAAVRALGRRAVATSSQAVAVQRGIVKTGFQIVASEVAGAIKGAGRALFTTASQATASIERHGSTFAGVISTNVAAVKLLTGKLTGLFSPQTVAANRLNTMIVWTSDPNVARSMASRSLFLFHVPQGQIARAITWYRFYVQPWAYQQTILLPPGGGLAEPPDFGPIDPADQTIFAFDWSARAYSNDAIVSANVVSVPPGLVFAPWPLFINGTLVEVTIAPFSPAQLPATYRLRCTAVFASGRISSFSIPVMVRTL